MSFSAVDAYRKSVDNFILLRGKLPYLYQGLPIPLTNWNDVAQFYSSFRVKTDPFVNQKSWPSSVQHDLTRRSAEWMQYAPFAVAIQIYGVYDAPAKIGRNMLDKVPYPSGINELFWVEARKYALAVDSLGAVPGKWEIFKESVAEAAREAPQTVRDAVNQVVPDLPSIHDWIAFFKWGTVAAGGFAAWWYLVRPYIAKRRKELSA